MIGRLWFLVRIQAREWRHWWRSRRWVRRWIMRRTPSEMARAFERISPVVPRRYEWDDLVRADRERRRALQRRKDPPEMMLAP